jgi:hypothetical protein
MDKEHREITAWLSPLNFFKTQDDVLKRRQEGTGQWLLETRQFADWVSGKEKSLWCPGIRMVYPDMLSNTGFSLIVHE